MCSVLNSLNPVKSGSVNFVTHPKQGLAAEADVLHSVGVLEYSVLNRVRFSNRLRHPYSQTCVKYLTPRLVAVGEMLICSKIGAHLSEMEFRTFASIKK